MWKQQGIEWFHGWFISWKIRLKWMTKKGMGPMTSWTPPGEAGEASCLEDTQLAGSKKCVPPRNHHIFGWLIKPIANIPKIYAWDDSSDPPGDHWDPPSDFFTPGWWQSLGRLRHRCLVRLAALSQGHHGGWIDNHGRWILKPKWKIIPLSWLVVWNINFIFPYIGNVIIPIDSYFSEGWPGPTNQKWCRISLLSRSPKWIIPLIVGLWP